MRKLLPFILSAVLVVFVAAYWVLNYTGNNADLADGRTCVITVENGMTAADIANMLHKEKLIKRPESFRLEARFMGLEGKLQAGKYEIEAGKSNSEIIDILARGQVKTVSFTVPEGYTVNKIAAKLAAEGLGDAEKFKEAARNYTPYKYMETNNPDVIYKAEGFIYPSTYLFTDGMTEKDMLATMVKEFNTQINHEKIGDAAEKADMQLRDIVTIASMVELVLKRNSRALPAYFCAACKFICRYSPTPPFSTFWVRRRKKLPSPIRKFRTRTIPTLTPVCRRDRLAARVWMPLRLC